eukprot:200321_1
MYLTRFSFIIYIAFTQQNGQHYPCIGATAGYNCNYRPKYSQRDDDHFFCDIDIVPKNITWNEFESKYYFKKPVVINTTLSDWTMNTTLWNKNSLLSLFGNHYFEVGDDYEGTINGGYMVNKMKLISYFKKQFNKKTKTKNKNKLYVFDRSFLTSFSLQYIYDNIINITAVPYFDTAHNNIKTHYKKYNVLYNNMEYNSRIFALGQSGTGMSFHNHGETWFFSIYGRKRFFLYPPNVSPIGGFGAGFTSRDWYKYIYKHLHLKYDINKIYEFEFNQTFIKPRSSIFTRNNGSKILNSQSDITDILSTDFIEYNNEKLYGTLFKPIECMLLDGQILYFPEFWWHQVLNLGDTIGIAMNINNPYSGYSSLSNWTAYYQRIRTNLQNKNFLRVLNKTDLEMDALKIDNLINVQKSILSENVPLNAVYEYMIGNDLCLMGKKFYEIGRKHLINAILMDPTYIYSYITLASTYMTTDDIEIARKVLEIAYVVNQNHDIVSEKLTQILLKQNQINLVQHVLKHKPLPIV